MLHVVEVRFPVEHFRELLLRVRGWLNTENGQPSTFRYWFSEPDAVFCASISSLRNRRAPSPRRSAALFWSSPTRALARRRVPR